MSDLSIVSTWERLVRLQRITTKAMDENLRARCAHSLDDYDVLHQVSANGAPIRMGELAERLLVANSSCHRIVGRLVEAGLVNRLPGVTDRREVLVDLTSDGRRLHRRMAVIHTRDIERLFGSRLSADDRVELDGVLGRLLPAPFGVIQVVPLTSTVGGFASEVGAGPRPAGSFGDEIRSSSVAARVAPFSALSTSGASAAPVRRWDLAPSEELQKGTP